jgi:C_GCAxxG_C_C family probable redox protein
LTPISHERAMTDTLDRYTDPGPGHINCAQAVVRFALLVLGHDPDLATTARYLGGGIAAMGETCGAITGAALALGLRDMHLQGNDPDLRPRTAERLRELMRGFDLKFGARRCADLTGFDLSAPEGHKAFVESEAHKRCADYVGWVCDQLAPLLIGPDAATGTPTATPH